MMFYVEWAPALGSASIWVLRRNPEISRLYNENRTGPGPNWEQTKGSVLFGSGIAPMNRLHLTARSI